MTTKKEHLVCLECGHEMKKPTADGNCPKCGGSDIDVLVDTWQHEIAMEAGMLHGIAAYNDAMGY